MDIIRRISKPAAAFLAIYMLMLSGPYQSAHAALISTETVLNDAETQRARNYLSDLLARQHIQTELVSHGIDPQEAKARIESLSDAEINDIVSKLEQLPAGGFFETFLIVAFLIFIILLATDIAGYTDVFPFVDKSASKKTDRRKTGTDTGENAVKEVDAKEVSSESLNNVEVKPDEHMIIFFEQDSNELSGPAIETLDRTYDILSNNPDSDVTIFGYPSSGGSSSYNRMLSENRVYTVKMYLLGKGLEPSKTKVVLDEKRVTPPVDGVELIIRFPQ